VSHSSSRNGQKPSPAFALTEYVDVQKGTQLVNILGLTSALTIVSTLVRPHVIETIALLLQLATAVCFCAFFIRIKDGYLLWQYGPGWIRGKVALSAIESSRVVRSRYIYRCGFNLKAGPVLEIFHSGDKRLRLSTPRAEELRHLIENAAERRSHEGSC
jgi:hypothetical protein